MKIVFLILAHHKPENLSRLITKLKDKSIYFVIHLDSRADDEKFFEIKGDKHIHFIPRRVPSVWAGFGLVEATLNGLAYIRENLPFSERVVLLSGQDYPIKPIDHICSEFENNPEKIFMEYFPIPDKRWLLDGVTRFPFFERISSTIKIFGGSQWWSFPTPIIDFILEFVNNNKFYCDYFRRVIVPDESFFQTLLLNSGEDFILENINNELLHLIEWEPPFQHPRTFSSMDWHKMRSDKHLFARKFDVDVDKNILDLIDENILVNNSNELTC